jgi:hypothetical protein
MLPLAHLQPFAGLRSYELELVDAAGAAMAFVDLDPVEGAQPPAPGFDLRGWYARSGFVAGDSILVTVARGEPLQLQIEREPAAEFRSAAVSAQDAELLDAIVQRVNRSQVVLLPCDEVVLPIFAAAAWRGAYPGSPWQHLVTRDARLQLVDDIFLTNQRHPSLRLFASDEVFEPPPVAERERHAADAALLAEIDVLQQALRRSREQDADTGLWNGQIQRASAAYTTFDSYGEQRGGRPGPARPLDRYDEGDDDDDELELGLNSWDADDLFGEDDAPSGLQAARARMLAALPPGVAERLEQARPEEAEVIIAQHLNLLLVKEPGLFPEIDLSASAGEGGLDPLAESLFDPGSWQEDLDGDDWDDGDDDLDGDDEVSSVYAESSDLIGQFHDYLSELGKSGATARARSRSVLVYAEFLASYYNRTLAEGDYATLDECMFYYYPRRVMNNSARQAREICTAVKQFYSFMKERGVIGDDRFAQALWRRRDQAATVVQIYDRISSDSPSFETLFARLFQPYTE